MSTDDLNVLMNQSQTEFNISKNVDMNESNFSSSSKVEFRDEALQLIEFTGNNFKLNPEALEIINSIDEDLIVVAVVGKARTGKSYLMNLMLDNIGKGKGVIY
jgi:polynucleotide 5'-kinase involved in rRNA processing